MENVILSKHKNLFSPERNKSYGVELWMSGIIPFINDIRNEIIL